MKTAAFALAFLLLSILPANAEVFQFVDAGNNSYLVYWAVWQSQTLLGYTDGFGRLRINQPTGTFFVTLKCKGQSDKSTQITVTGAQTMTQVRI